jgi:uncharacterized protein YidB (DUF937 family)
MTGKDLDIGERLGGILGGRGGTGTGENRSVTGDQLRQALGDDTLGRVAREAGVTPRAGCPRRSRWRS